MIGFCGPEDRRFGCDEDRPSELDIGCGEDAAVGGNGNIRSR